MKPRDRNRPNSVSITTLSAYRGLLPPPEMLAQFNQVIPNGADRIIAMAEGQLQHAQTLERALVSANIASQRRAQLYGFSLALVAILGGIGLIAFDKSPQGLVAIITAFASAAGLFVYGRYEQERERERKRQEARDASAQQRLPLD
jgi:uncharacterized membrane protein